MKNILAFILLACIAVSCNFSAGTNKDLVTGMSISYNGFRVGKATLVNSQNQATTSNVVAVNETVAIVVDDIEGYELLDGKAFPILDLTVTDKNGKVALEGKDILATPVGYSPADAAVLRGTITVGAPMVAGETYHTTMVIWDKLKPESKITVEVDLVVK